MLAPSPSRAAADETGPSGSVLLTGGSLAQSIDLTLSKPPAPGDFFTVNVPTKQTRITLLTQPGQRITAANAATLGLDWRQYPQKLPLGSDDGGTTAEITFTQAARAGRYRIELTSPALRSPLSADVRFTSRMENFTRLIRSAPGAQMSEPVKLSRTAVVRLKIMQSETVAMLDIVVPDSAAKVTLTLPSGRILSPSQPRVRDVEWRRIEVRHGKEKGEPGSDSVFPVEDMLMPLDGIHYLAALDEAEPGPYEIRAARGNSSTGEFRVAFIPFEGFARAVVSREESLQRPAPGTVRIRPQPLPFEGHAGDSLELVVRLVGDLGPESPKFEVRIEHRAALRVTDIGIEYANPDPVESRPAEFARTADGVYHGRVTLPDPDMVRIAVRANGTTTAGKPFTDEAIATGDYMIVKPVVAHFLSLSERADGVKGSSKFDRLEVSAELDVIEPGDYSMFFTLHDAAGQSLSGGPQNGSAKLLAGRQQLTVSVPARKIWSELHDGPFDIRAIQISRRHPTSTSAWVDVPTGGASLRTAAYTRDQWNPGPFYGEDWVSIHGLRPAASGRFRYAEVEWDVTTPGDTCSWYRVIEDPVITAGGRIPIQSGGEVTYLPDEPN